jgi:hypothetical protein
MGVGRNLAYKKDGFSVNGFIEHILQVRSGDDDLFINQAANGKIQPLLVRRKLPAQTKTSYTDWLIQKEYCYCTINTNPLDQLQLDIFHSRCAAFLIWRLFVDIGLV